MDKFIEKYKAVMSKTFKENFNREVDEAEMEQLLNQVLPFMQQELAKIPDFTEAMFKRYMGGVSSLGFSPAIVAREINRARRNFGEETLMHSNDFKRLREMEVASRFCIAHRKAFGEKFMIKAQDNPDIVLFITGEKLPPTKFLEGYQLEVMSVPEIAKGKLDADLSASLPKFITERKFPKRYGLCALIVSLDFNEQGVDFKAIGEALKQIQGNPYESVWLTGIVNSGLTAVTVMQIFPSFQAVNFDLTNETNLLY